MKKFPSSVYRLQFNERFSLKQAISLLPYLKRLGIEGVYCSPYFAAYSPHGYDIIDPHRVNPVVGSSKDFARFCKELKALGMHHIADIVPNHMGILGKNLWWKDVLAKGKKSKYAKFFDINWKQEKLLLPLLSEPYKEALRKKKLTIVKEGGKLFAQCRDQLFPVNGKHLPCTLKDIDALLQKQTYRLVHWLRSGQETSYRRFFNIGELVGLHMEKKAVFDAYHKWIFSLLKEESIDGLRIDHPDGLYDPEEYFERIRKKHQGLLIVEKILGWEEELPPRWKVDGTVGYEFLNRLTGIFIKKGEGLTEVYSRFIGRKIIFQDMLYEKKKSYMATEMAGDVGHLADILYAFSPNHSKEKISLALYELLAAFPLYRSYLRPKGKMSSNYATYWKEAFQLSRRKSPNLKKEIFDFLERIIFLKEDHPILRDFLMRLQQLSAPVMAKGFEDIILYNYNRLLACNEVGSAPDRGGVSIEEFHCFCKKKRQHWPFGFLATSTHDTKRSMDVRMQLAVLSEIPDRWEAMLTVWSRLNQKHRTKIDGHYFPDRNTEYFLYQTLLGVWPSRPTFSRLWLSFQKSIREARVHTSWRLPNILYEKACKLFLRAILKKGGAFLQSFQPFQKEIEEYGQWKSLAATALQMGCPGIVDVYQGCEYFHYTLVDPDNRAPINFKQPKTLKFFLHKTALNFRKGHKNLFLKGEYIPLEVRGPQKDRILAFLRTYQQETLLVAAVRFFCFLEDLEETSILLPKKLGKGRSVFTKESFEGESFPTKQLFSQAPFAWVFWS